MFPGRARAMTGWRNGSANAGGGVEEAIPLRLLADVTNALKAGRGWEGSLQRLAELLVERLADWCVIDLLDERGRARRAVVTGVVQTARTAPDRESRPSCSRHGRRALPHRWPKPCAEAPPY